MTPLTSLIIGISSAITFRFTLNIVCTFLGMMLSELASAKDELAASDELPSTSPTLGAKTLASTSRCFGS